MIFKKHLLVSAFAIVACLPFAYAQSEKYPPTAQVSADFKKILDRPKVDFNASFQVTKTDSVITERGYIYTEKNEKVPILIYKPANSKGKLPVVVYLHGTGGKKEDKDIKNVLSRLVKRGMMGVAIDARFHGERIAGGAHSSNEYVDAISKAWENTDVSHQTHPFLWDTVYDLWRLTDYLVTRPDVDAARLGMGGISMGGIETWMAASVDTRIKVVVLDIAAQSFQWSLVNNKWQGRAHTIAGAHMRAAKDMGDSTLNKRNVKALWGKLIPGITGEFDCPSMIRLMAPRPLLVLNTEKDANCPLPGAKIAFASATLAYGTNAADKLKMDIAPNLPHKSTPEHQQMAVDWFVKWL